MTVLKTWSGDGLSAGAFSTGGGGSAGTGDTYFDGIAASSAITIVASGGRSPRLQHAQTASNACAHYWNFSATATVGGRFYYTSPSSLPGSSWIVLRLQGSSGSVLNARIDIGSSGDVRIRNGSAQQAASSTGIIAANTTYRFEWTLTSTGSASGVFTVRVFANDGTSYSAEVTATADFGTNSDRIWFGNGNTSPTVGNCYFDDMAVTNTASWIGPKVVTTPLSVTAVTATPQNLYLGGTATMGVTTADGSGTKTYAWTILAGAPSTSPAQFSSASSSAPTFTPTAVGTYTVRCTVSDTTGSDSEDVVVTVADLPTVARYATLTATGWTASSGTALSCMADDDDTTTITSASPASGDAHEGYLAPMAAPLLGITVYLEGLVRTGGAAGTAVVKVYDDATLKATKSGVTIPASAADTAVVFTASDLSALDPDAWDEVGSTGHCRVKVRAEYTVT